MSPSPRCCAAVNHSHLPTRRENVMSSKIPAQGHGWVCNTPSYGLLGQSSSTPNTWVYSQKIWASVTRMQSHFHRTRGQTSLFPSFSLFHDLECQGMGPSRAALPLLWFGGSVVAMWGEGHRIQVEVNRGSKWPPVNKKPKGKGGRMGRIHGRWALCFCLSPFVNVNNGILGSLLTASC